MANVWASQVNIHDHSSYLKAVDMEASWILHKDRRAS